MSTRSATICGILFLLLFAGGGCAGVGTDTLYMGIDTVRLERTTTYEKAWVACLRTLRLREIDVIDQNMDTGIIDAADGATQLRIQVRYAAPQAIIDIKSRRDGKPDLPSAEQLLVEINRDMRRGQGAEP